MEYLKLKEHIDTVSREFAALSEQMRTVPENSEEARVRREGGREEGREGGREGGVGEGGREGTKLSIRQELCCG